MEEVVRDQPQNRGGRGNKAQNNDRNKDKPNKAPAKQDCEDDIWDYRTRDAEQTFEKKVSVFDDEEYDDQEDQEDAKYVQK